MKTVQISFLGRTPKEEGGSYRKTCYSFQGELDGPSAFFGYNLYRRVKPDRLVILGTSGSMWDHLFEHDIDLGSQAEDDRLTLVEAVENQFVTGEHLSRLEPLLAAHLGCEVALELIPYCQTEEEQIKLIDIIADQVQPRDKVHLDITHGFRTLPMITLMSALYLREVREAEIAGIWYGSYDPDTNNAPVQNLDGLLRIADWLAALHSYKKDGDYSVFSEFLDESGRFLAQAAFFERTGNPVKARANLSTWSKQGTFPESGPGKLFRDEIQRRIAWHRQGYRPQHEARLAREYLARRDYLRAAIFAQESLISRQVFNAKEADNYENRERAREQLREDTSFRTLGQARNAMVHGLRAQDRDAQQGLQDENTLRTQMLNLFKKLEIDR